MFLLFTVKELRDLDLTEDLRNTRLDIIGKDDNEEIRMSEDTAAVQLCLFDEIFATNRLSCPLYCDSDSSMCPVFGGECGNTPCLIRRRNI